MAEEAEPDMKKQTSAVLEIDMKGNKPAKTIPAIPTVDIANDMRDITTDEALARVSIMLAETKHSKTLSHLSHNEVLMVAQLFAVAEKTRNKMMALFLENFLLLRVSLERKGRGELLEIAKAGQQREESKFSRLRSMIPGFSPR